MNYKTIRHAIEKECRRISLTDWCENWGFTADDFNKYLDAADKALRAQHEQPNEPLTGPLRIGDFVHGMKIIGLDALAGTITLSGWESFYCKLEQEELQW